MCEGGVGGRGRRRRGFMTACVREFLLLLSTYDFVGVVGFVIQS